MLTKVGALIFGVALLAATAFSAVVPGFERATERAGEIDAMLKDGDVVLVAPFTGAETAKLSAARMASFKQALENLRPPVDGKARVVVTPAPGKDGEVQATPVHTHQVAGLIKGDELVLSLEATGGGQVGQTLGSLKADWPSSTMMWLVFCVIAIVGLVLWRLGARQEARAAATESAQSGDNPFSLLAEMQKPLDELAEAMSALTETATCARVDVVLETYVLPFAEVRRKIIDRLGMGKGSEILVVVAYGERMLNRVWSAASDGHLPEARSSFPEAHMAFKEAQRLASTAIEGTKSASGGETSSTSVPAT